MAKKKPIKKTKQTKNNKPKNVKKSTTKPGKPTGQI